MEQNNLPAPTSPGGEVGPPRFTFAEGSEEPSGSSGPHLKRYFGAVLRYKWLVLLAGVVGIAVGLVTVRYVRLTYRAQVTLWVQQQADRNSEIQGPIQSSQLLEDNGWVQLLRSFAVLDSVVLRERLYTRVAPEDIDLIDGFELDSILRPGSYRLRVSNDGRTVELRTADGLTVDRVNVGEALGRQLGFIWIPPAAALRPGREARIDVLLPRAAAVALQEELDVQMPLRSSFMAVNFATGSAERAASVVNAVADQFVAVSAELKRARLVELRNILESQLVYARANLEAAEFELNNFLVQTITLPSQPATPVNPGTQETRSDVIDGFFDQKIERDNVQRDREALERTLAGALSIDAMNAIGSVRESPEMAQALSELTTKRADLRALLRVYTLEHRAAQTVAEDVRNLETRVIPQLGRNLLAELDVRIATMDAAINSTSAELREIPPRAIDEARYRRNTVIAENLYNELRQRYENARLATETSTPDVSILSRATPAQFPASDIRLLLLAFCAIAGVGAGIGIAILLEIMDKRVRYPEQISDGMHLPILGAIPDLTTRRLGFGSAPDKAELVEALRGIRLSLAHAHGAAGPIMVTITSPGSGDGKTFLSSNLAVNFAELGLRVLVVDGDTRRGTLHRVLNIDRKPGLTDYLTRSASLEDIVRPTSVPQLDVIPCGTRSARAPELLSSSRMGDLLAEIRPRYDVILMDSPPLGAGIDPLVLSTITGNVVLIVRTGKTDRELAEAKLAILDRLPVRVLGAVMNGISTDVAFRYYSYLPGYEAGQEESDDTDRLLQPS